MTRHLDHSPPPEPYIDEACLDGTSEMYIAPLRTEDDWIRGDELWYPERVSMYELARQQLLRQGYDPEQSQIAVLLAQSPNNMLVERTVGISTTAAQTKAHEVYSASTLGHNRVAVANRVLRIGLQQLILKSLIDTSQEPDKDELSYRAWRLLHHRLRYRIESFGFDAQDAEIGHLVLNGLSIEVMSHQIRRGKTIAQQRIGRVYAKTRCDDRLAFVHRMYGTHAASL